MKRQPVYQPLREDLAKEIRSGRLQQNDFLPSENQLAEKYEISRPSVRQALGELVAMGMVERVPGKGTVVTYRRPVTPEKVIKLLFPEEQKEPMNAENSPFGYTILHESSLACEAYGYLAREEHLPAELITRERCDGSILVGSGQNEALLDALHECGARYVSVMNTHKKQVNSLTSGNYSGLYAASNYFTSLGRRKPLYLDHYAEGGQSQAASSSLRDRYDGFVNALHKNAIDFSPGKQAFRNVGLTASAYYQVVMDYLDAGNECDVIYTAGGTTGVIGAVRAIEERGLRIPEDIAVVGLRVGGVFTLQAHGASVVDLMAEALAREAVRVLVGLLEGTISPPVQKNLGYRFEPGPTLPPVSAVIGEKESSAKALAE
jgi:GntR family transcriptional regulator, arabinose operon transcriptional repressor